MLTFGIAFSGFMVPQNVFATPACPSKDGIIKILQYLNTAKMERGFSHRISSKIELTVDYAKNMRTAELYFIAKDVKVSKTRPFEEKKTSTSVTCQYQNLTNGEEGLDKTVGYQLVVKLTDIQ